MAALTIGLGLGANTAIFAVLQAVVLQQLPYDQPDRVVAVRTVAIESGNHYATSFPQFEDYESRNRVFSSVAAWRAVWPTMVHEDGRPPTRVMGVGVTHEMFSLLGTGDRVDVKGTKVSCSSVGQLREKGVTVDHNCF